MCTFYLGTHETSWRGRTRAPLFLSARRLRRRGTRQRAIGPWILDSGAFSEIAMYGRWTIEPEQYVDEVRNWQATIGNLEFACIQDWMCEPDMREKTGGLSVEEHQLRTIESFNTLRRLAPEIPWMPVIQGFKIWEYVDHVKQYRAYAGVDLAELARVGVGSICKRQATDEIREILGELHGFGISLHAFGVKKAGLVGATRFIDSADSMAWSFRARRAEPLPGCTHKRCVNCYRFAMKWRGEVLDIIEKDKAQAAAGAANLQGVA